MSDDDNEYDVDDLAKDMGNMKVERKKRSGEGFKQKEPTKEDRLKKIKQKAKNKRNRSQLMF